MERVRTSLRAHRSWMRFCRERVLSVVAFARADAFFAHKARYRLISPFSPSAVREREKRKIFKGARWWEKITPRRRRALREARLYVTKRRRLRALPPFDVVFIIDSSRKESTRSLLIICSPPFFPYLFLHRLSKMPPKRRCAIASPRSAPRRKSPMR